MTTKLPLWRLIAGIAVLGSFALVIAFLTPVYVDDLRLYRYTRTLPEAPDDTLIAEVVAKAQALDLPVKPTDVHIAHTGPKPEIELRYTVKMDVLFYPVDLHFPTIR